MNIRYPIYEGVYRILTINLPTCLYAPSINPLCFMRLAVVLEHLNSSAIPARP